jgi:hypothetical protein
MLPCGPIPDEVNRIPQSGDNVAGTTEVGDTSGCVAERGDAVNRSGRWGIDAGRALIRLDWRRRLRCVPGLVDGSIALQTNRRRLVRVAAVLVAVTSLSLAGLHSVPARADDKVPLGGGAGIVINGDTLCTLTTIGTDGKGELIGFTSAHCGGPGAHVAAEAAQNRGAVGTMVTGNDDLDYAVIQFDRAKVTPVADIGGFAINGIGPDPAFGQIACKQGRTTGNSCGVTWGPGQDPGTIVMQVCGQPGDSGGPVTVDNMLVGMIHGAFSENLPVCVVKYIPLHTPAVVVSINAVLADINSKNRPGAGFVPVPAST